MVFNNLLLGMNQLHGKKRGQHSNILRRSLNRGLTKSNFHDLAHTGMGPTL